jgi:1D-myo-inositol 3-kinase
VQDSVFDAVHVGSASRDLTEDDPRGWRLGGGVSYASLTTARLGLRTAAVVGVDRTTSSAAELDLLREAGVTLHLASVAQAPVFRNEESAGGRVQTLIAPASPLHWLQLPEDWRGAHAWSLVPVAGEVADDWAAIADPALVALGWQGLLRSLVAGAVVTIRGAAPSPLVTRADIVGVSEHDLAPGTNAADLLAMLKPRAILVVTDGSRGGRTLRRDAGRGVDVRSYEAVAAARTVDPTGAGDVFLAAFLAVTLRPDLADRISGRASGVDLRFAATAASFVVESAGLGGVPMLDSVRERLARSV